MRTTDNRDMQEMERMYIDEIKYLRSKIRLLLDIIRQLNEKQEAPDER